MRSKNPTPPVTPERIAERAYELFLARGGHAGYHVEDWLQAERELMGANGDATAAAGSTKPARKRTTSASTAAKTEKADGAAKPKPAARTASRSPKA